MASNVATVEGSFGTATFDHSNSVFLTWISEVFPSWSPMDSTTYPLTQLRYPLVGCLIYLMIDLLLAPPRDQKRGEKRRKKRMMAFCALHNLLLMVFSGMCCYVTVPIAWSILKRGWQFSMCEHGFKDPTMYGTTWDSYGYWIWLFYLSKFWEFIDTWILLAKGRRPSFLQV